eukprot:g8490.t1
MSTESTRKKHFSVWGRSRNRSENKGKTQDTNIQDVSEEVSELYVEKLFDQLIPYLNQKHKYLPEKQLYYPIVRDNIATGIRATGSMVKYWENAAKNHHDFSNTFFKTVIPHIPHTEIYQMRKFMSIIRHLNQARMEATLTYCKNVLMQVVKPAKKLMGDISQSLAANDKDMASLIEAYERKEKNIKQSVRELQTAEKNLDSSLIALNEHKKHVSKHFNVNVGSAANEIYRGFLKKKGSGKSGGMFGRRNWKERLFVLLAPEEGKSYATLNYYGKDAGMVPKGSVIIDGSTIVNLVDDKKYTNAFNIMTEGFHFDGSSSTHYFSDDDNDNIHTGEHSSNLAHLSNYLHRKPKSKKTSLMLQAATAEDLVMWTKCIERTVALVAGKHIVSQKLTVSPNEFREVQQDATNGTSQNHYFARDAKGIELEELMKKAKAQLIIQQQQLEYATQSLENHHAVHKEAVSRIIRKLLRVELYRGEQQRKLMKTFIVLESIFEEKTRPFIHAALESVHTVDAVEDIKFFVNNIVGSNGIDYTVSEPIGTLAPLHILSGNRPVISTDLMQELIDNKTISKDILKNTKDITKEYERGSIFDESTLFEKLDNTTDDQLYNLAAFENENSMVLQDEEPLTETTHLTSETLDQIDQATSNMVSPVQLKRSSSWGGTNLKFHQKKTNNRGSAMSEQGYQKRRITDEPKLATIKFEGGFSHSIDSWEAMMDQLDIEKNDFRSAMSKIISGPRTARNSLEVKLGGRNRKKSASKVSRRKSSLTPFAQALLGTSNK